MTIAICRYCPSTDFVTTTITIVSYGHCPATTLTIVIHGYCPANFDYYDDCDLWVLSYWFCYITMTILIYGYCSSTDFVTPS